MNWLFPAVISTLIGTLFLFLVYLYLFSVYRQKSILIWASSWLVYSLRFILELAGIRYPSDFLMVSTQIVTLSSGILLLWGTYEFIQKKIPSYWIIAGVIGILWIPAAKISGASFLIVTAPGFTLLAIIYIITGIELIRFSPGSKKAVFITGLCFILWGIHKADFPFLRTVEWFAPWGFIIGAALEFGVALGMMMIFFESMNAKLSSSEKSYRDLFNATSEAIFVIDPETGRILDINRRVTELYLFTKEEAMNCSIADIYENSPVFSKEEAFKKIALSQKESPQLFEWHSRKKDGSLFWGDVSLTKTNLNGKEVILTSVRDITDRKESKKNIAHARARFQHIMENMPLLAVTLDCGGRVVFANHFLSRVTGWEINDLIGKNWFETITPDQPELKNFFDNTCAYSETGLPTYNENNIITKAGEKRVIRWSNIINHDVSGNIEGVTGIGEDITDRIIMIETLNERETLYRSVIEFSVDGFWIADSNGKIMEINESYCRMSGYKRNEILNMHISDLEASENTEDIATHIRQVMRKGSDIFETRHRKKDGTIMHVEVNACFHPVSGGLFFVFIRDLYKRKRSEMMLRIRAELSDLADKGMIDELITLALDHAELLTGSTIGFFHFVDEDQKRLRLQSWSSNTLKKMCTAKGKGTHYPINKAGVWADGFYEKTPVIHNDYNSLPHKKGMPEGHAQVTRELVVPVIRNDLVVGILGVGNKTSDYDDDDIEVLKNLASMAMDVIILKKSEDDLKESEANLKLAQQIALLSRWEFDHSSRKIIWSKGVCELLEIDQESLKPSLDSFLPFVHPEDSRSMRRFSKCVLKGSISKDITLRIVSSTEKTKWIRIVSRTESDREGKPVKTVGTVQDITALKQSEIERQELERQMLHVQKLESLGVLAGGMAHDFNNILTAILGYAEISMMGMSPEDLSYKSLNEIRNASRRAADICHQMLAYAGRGTFVVEPLLLGGLITEMADLLKTSISKKASLCVKIAENIPPINADATQIRQVVMNLITNASDSINENKGEISISTGMKDSTADNDSEIIYGEDLQEGPYVYIEVSDTGCGMDKETINRIFEPFFTTKFTGRGLGMAAVLGIVKSHRGCISIKSKPGKGTTFRLFFPPCDLSVTPSSVEKIKNNQEAISGLVLLADDEAAIRAVGKRIIEKMGLSVITASDGEEAVRLFTENRDKVDLAIVDLTMPKMDGAEVFAEIRKKEPDLPIMIISGYTEYEIRSQFAGKTVSGFIQKPFSTREFMEKVGDALDIDS